MTSDLKIDMPWVPLTHPVWCQGAEEPRHELVAHLGPVTAWEADRDSTPYQVGLERCDELCTDNEDRVIGTSGLFVAFRVGEETHVEGPVYAWLNESDLDRLIDVLTEHRRLLREHSGTDPRIPDPVTADQPKEPA